MVEAMDCRRSLASCGRRQPKKLAECLHVGAQLAAALFRSETRQAVCELRVLLEIVGHEGARGPVAADTCGVVVIAIARGVLLGDPPT